MPEQYAEAVVRRALEYRMQASQFARNTLNKALDGGVKVRGYRHASKAKQGQLENAVLSSLERGDDQLSGAVLKVWQESHAPLRERVTNHLQAVGVATPGVDAELGRFRGEWRDDDYSRHYDHLLETQDGVVEDDLALMLCVTSGLLHAVDPLAVASPRFQRWLEELAKLSVEAPDWQDVRAFAQRVTNIAETKKKELVDKNIAVLTDAIGQLREKFKIQLKYLGVDLGGWLADAPQRLLVLSEAREIVASFKKQLSEYAELQPQAASRELELRRAGLRGKCEEEMLATVGEWSKLSPDPPEVREYPAEYDVTASPDAAVVPDKSGDVERLERQVKSLTERNAKLEETHAGYRLQKEQLGQEIGDLKSRLQQSRENEQYWRKAYVGVKGRAHADDCDEPASLGTVTDVIEQAEKTFSDELLFALNNKARKNTPFQKPREVFDALAWLATEYRHMRPNPGAGTDFDRSIKEACPGWSYKPNQTETTMGMYSEWYKTNAGGRTYELANHIGKGNGRDPKHNIRIAFAWDEERGQVVVGYIGLHQKNRQS